MVPVILVKVPKGIAPPAKAGTMPGGRYATLSESKGEFPFRIKVWKLTKNAREILNPHGSDLFTKLGVYDINTVFLYGLGSNGMRKLIAHFKNANIPFKVEPFRTA